MTTISEFIESEALEETIVSNCPKYRKKFSKIIEKAGVGDSDIEDENAIKKIGSTISWNWAGFVVSSFWAIYRKEKILGWGALILTLLIGVTAVFVPAIDKLGNVLPIVLSVVIGMYGNSFILRNALKTYANTTSPTDREQRSTIGVIVAILLTIAYAGIWIFLIAEGIVPAE